MPGCGHLTSWEKRCANHLWKKFIAKELNVSFSKSTRKLYAARSKSKKLKKLCFAKQI
jgi:hypothetical protein